MSSSLACETPCELPNRFGSDCQTHTAATFVAEYTTNPRNVVLSAVVLSARTTIAGAHRIRKDFRSPAVLLDGKGGTCSPTQRSAHRFRAARPKMSATGTKHASLLCCYADKVDLRAWQRPRLGIEDAEEIVLMIRCVAERDSCCSEG